MNKIIPLLILTLCLGTGIAGAQAPTFTYVSPQQASYWVPPPEFEQPAEAWKPPAGYERYAQPWAPPEGWETTVGPWSPPQGLEKPEEWEPPPGF